MKKETCIREKATSSLIISFLLLIAFAVPSVWAYGEKNSNENGVRIQVTPQVLSPDKVPQFKIRLNTHSVELNQDLKRVAELYDSQGRVYKAERWEGSPPGGHHRSGTLFFPVLQAPAGDVTLIIREIGGVPKREFSWKIE